MKAPFSVVCLIGVILAALGPSRAALAASGDAGVGVDASADAGALAQTADSGASGNEESPFACNKALCSTATGDTACSVAAGLGHERAALPVSVAAGMAVMGLGAVRRRARREKERTR